MKKLIRKVKNIFKIRQSKGQKIEARDFAFEIDDHYFFYRYNR